MIFNYFNFFESLKVALINMVAISMTPSKSVTLGFFNIKILLNKDCEIIIYAYGINKTLSRDSIYILDVQGISILQEFDQKNYFSGWCSWLKFHKL